MPDLPTAVLSPRLTIRCWTEDDAPRLHAAIRASIEHLRPWMPWAAAEALPVEDQRELIRTWCRQRNDGGDVVYGVFLDAIPIGGTGLHRRLGPDALEIGYWIHVDHVGKGYATEVAAALTNVAFTQQGIERVEIHHDKANIASGRVPQRLGFILVGETPDEITSPGEIGIKCSWRVTPDEWAPRTR